MKLWVLILILVVSSSMSVASRTKQPVQFDLQGANMDSPVVPFIAEVPKSYRSHFVRFVHPKTGRSAVARVTKRSGNQFKTNLDLAKVIGIKSFLEPVYIEEVY